MAGRYDRMRDPEWKLAHAEFKAARSMLALCRQRYPYMFEKPSYAWMTALCDPKFDPSDFLSLIVADGSDASLAQLREMTAQAVNDYTDMCERWDILWSQQEMKDDVKALRTNEKRKREEDPTDDDWDRKRPQK